MADALVSALAQTILGSLNSVALQEIGLACGLKDEFSNLQSIFGTIQLVLRDAEVKQRKNDAIQNWLGKLKDAAYDVENILDQIATEGLRRRVDNERGMQHQLKSFLSKRNHFLFRYKMAYKVKTIRQKLDAIAKEKLQFHLSDGVMENRYGETLESRKTSSLVNELEIYGRKEEKEMIIKELFDSKHEQDDLFVYAIWGMGGLGKTTLTQMVYNDERIKNHFELRIWLCVSDDFSIQRLVSAILQSTGGVGLNISELDPLQLLLQERLKGRKFLLVLDDVWNENHRLWDGLREVLRCGSKGSMLMVTTRIQRVAIMMATIAPHNIESLSEDESWSLFKQRAFTTGEKEEENLVAIGKAIVKKCGGVPLAINALGSLMQFKSHESEWLAIKESEIWHLQDEENGILPALRLSYDNLLPQMRQCFAYCCIFPKDYVMEENHLVQLWMANGFIPSEGETDLHLTGHLIFKELVSRSFLQYVKVHFRIDRTCKMHDLMHDLALSVMKHEVYILEYSKMPKFSKMLRHLSFDSWLNPKNASKLKLPINNSLRSLIVHRGQHRDFEEGHFSFLSKQQYMRVLDINSLRVGQELQSSVCKLRYLKYLVMSCYNLKKLPESLTCLLNLQTLKLTDSYLLLELPKGLKVMKNLWFLQMDSFDSLVCTPPGLGDLTCLRRLSIFIVGKDASHQIDQLKELNLAGKLCIQGLENVRNSEDAKSANLMAKTDLTYLKLSWKNHMNKNIGAEVLEGLRPHQNLEKMSINSYQGFTFPNWMSTLALKNLKEISLEYCERCQHLPYLGKLPSLTCLTLIGMTSVKHLGVEWHENGERSFPALTTLIIERMPNLEEWIIPDSVESYSCLQDLKIRWCPRLKGLPFLPTLKTLDIYDSSVTLVESITSLTSLTSLELYKLADLDVLPVGLLQSHTSLETLRIRKLPIKTLSSVLNNLSALKTLSLNDCSNLEFLPEGLQYLNSLEYLEISLCDSIRSFPAAILESLSSLRSLKFNNCKKLNPLSGPLHRGIILQRMVINRCPELSHLPESMLQLSGLRQLDIKNCEGLCALPNWLGSLQSLSLLQIYRCDNLKSLPNGFQSLKSLKELSISYCPNLEKRCQKPNSEDWPKISHIPNIRINGKAIQLANQIASHN